MRRIFELLREDGQARRFFAAYAQSALATGAGYVALLLVGYERFRSPWAIALILLADVIPPMLLGPLFGAAADRWSRKWCAVTGDLVRAGAFTGVALVDGFAATFAFALLAGTGTGLFKPAVMAGMPSLVGQRLLPAATGLYGAITEIGFALGPALGALILLVTSAEGLLALNGATFAISALLLLTLSFGSRPQLSRQQLEERRGILSDTLEGLAVTVRMPGVRVVIAATSAVLLFGGMINVAELLLVRQLGAGQVGYSMLVAASGLGIALGSLIGSSGGSMARLKRGWLAGLSLDALGLIATGVVPVFSVALPTLLLAGIGNGLVIVYERLILQGTVRDALLGRVFGVQYSLDGAAFVLAYLAGGGLLGAVSPRTLFILAGSGALFVWAGATLSLRSGFAGDHPGSGLAVDEPVVESLAVGGFERRP